MRFESRRLEGLKLSLGLALFSFHRLQQLGGEFISLSWIALLSNLGCNLSPRPYGVCAIDHNDTSGGFWKDGVPQFCVRVASVYHPPYSADNVATIPSLGQDSLGPPGLLEFYVLAGTLLAADDSTRDKSYQVWPLFLFSNPPENPTYLLGFEANVLQMPKRAPAGGGAK